MSCNGCKTDILIMLKKRIISKCNHISISFMTDDCYNVISCTTLLSPVNWVKRVMSDYDLCIFDICDIWVNYKRVYHNDDNIKIMSPMTDDVYDINVLFGNYEFQRFVF